MIACFKPAFFFLTLFAATVFAAAESRAADRAPNVVFILADDLGWSDTTLYGTTQLYRTPNIQRLAKRGMLFTRAYSSSPLCSPTRSAVLTGLSPARTGITTPNCHLPLVRLQASEGTGAATNQKVIQPDSVSRLDPKYTTLAEMFREQGYATGHFGKWHLGPAPYSPLEHGFDVDVPHWPGPGPAGSYVAPWRYPDFDPNTPTEHIEDRMANEAVAFMETHQTKSFFLNYWMFSVHAPFDAKRDLIEHYKTIIDPNNPQRCPTYAAMIESMDDAVGTLIDTLDRLNLSDNTIVIFASDNGGNMYNEVDGTTATSNTPLRGGKATMYEGGVRGPAIVSYPGVVAPESQSDVLIQSEDFYPTLLELLSIERRPGQFFDGISFVPALRGKSLDRPGIFSYFPHSPPVPDWLPPSVSVTTQDWKLIRLFHQGEDGNHRHKLYHLTEDLGEANNLADKMPERVADMDAMIEDFLVRTNAVRPIPNPKFDPSKYDITLEGKGKLKGGAQNGPAAKKRKPGKPVAGWRSEGTSTLAKADAGWTVTSDGNDPSIVAELNTALPAEPLTLRFKMSRKSEGDIQVFWREQNVRPAFAAIQSVSIDGIDDGEIHEYAAEFLPEKPVIAIRIDPSRGPGQMTLSNIRLITATGKVVYVWKPALSQD